VNPIETATTKAGNPFFKKKKDIKKLLEHFLSLKGKSKQNTSMQRKPAAVPFSH